MSLRDHLQAIYDQHGKLTPELVVEEARAKSHPLHAAVFDRTKGEAAEAWYRHKAHELIRRVKVVYKDADEESQKSVRAFHAIKGDGPESFVYEPAERIVGDEFLFRLLMRNMESEQRQLARRQEEFLAYVSAYSKIRKR
jgi:hypothetical protein